MLKLFCWAVFIVFLCAVTPALAVDTPPTTLLTQVSSHRLVHDKLCRFHGLDDIPCLIYYDDDTGVTYVVIFERTAIGDLNITHVVAEKDNDEKVLWCRFDKCT